MTFVSYLFTALLSFVSLHPLHVTVTEVEMDDKDKQLEITIRVFVDDLEQTMRTRLKRPEFDILKPGDDLSVDKIMSNYVESHFKISLDNKDQEIKYLGHEIDGEAFVFYIEVSHVKRWKTIRVFNDIMCETFDDQSNLVHVTAQDIIHSLRLTGGTPSGTLTFESK